MDGATAESRLTAGAESRLTAARSEAIDCRVAGPADDADLRRLLRGNPMGGWVTVALEREPHYFAELIAGEEHQAIIARDAVSGSAVGMCARTVRPAYIDGAVRPLGYIGELRINAGYRHRYRILRKGFETLRRDLHEPLRTPFYLTAIVSDNGAARRLLEADLPGKPRYRPFAECSTLAIRTGAFPSDGCAPAEEADIPAIAACLARNHARYQFAPVWTETALRNAPERGGPRATDFIVMRSGERVTGCVALWDQSSVRQAVIRGYDPRIAAWRPLLNLTGALTGLPRLPRTGEMLRQIYLAFAAVDDDDPALLQQLVAAALTEARRRGFALGIIGMADSNPMLPTLRRTFRARAYRSRLYLAHWEHGRAEVDRLQPRIPHVEASLL